MSPILRSYREPPETTSDVLPKDFDHSRPPRPTQSHYRLSANCQPNAARQWPGRWTYRQTREGYPQRFVRAGSEHREQRRKHQRQQQQERRNRRQGLSSREAAEQARVHRGSSGP